MQTSHAHRTFALSFAILLLSACANGGEPGAHEAAAAAPVTVAAQPRAPGAAGKLEQGGEAVGRKVIRNAEMSLEADSPAEAQRKATQVAEANGGFVVTSDVRQSGDAHEEHVTVSLVLRVPAERFSATLDELRKVGHHVSHEKVSGQDVTEEFLDVEARLRAQRAVEAQFLEIMKDAKTVKDALEVQRQLGEVRSEIEKFEGRRRFLENQTSLSTVTLTISNRPQVAVAGRFSFGESARSAASDSLSVAAGIISGGIRLAGVLLPVALLIGLPIFLIIRMARRVKRAA